GGRMTTTEEPPEIGLQQLDAVLKFLPIFEESEVNFGKWVRQKNGPSQFTISQEATDFIETLYAQKIVFSFDWPNWKVEASRLYTDPQTLQQADLLALRKLLTTHVRQDRFSDGHLTYMFECGHLTAILRRLEEIREGMNSD
ncbi:MAG: hypothetical protein JXA42_00910, partial [Anaerolineales bacterium]|nr:hypothetical protein [Anaerolineales bacterium]